VLPGHSLQKEEHRFYSESDYVPSFAYQFLSETGLQIHYSLAYAKVMSGEMTKPHKLRACEVYYIMDGEGLMHIDEESFEVNPECAVYVPPRSTQYIENTGSSDLKFLCIVEPAWREEDEEVFDS
jgi:mannose-6-phosphate isomerase-like protein (cupin superfamily)